VEFGVLLGDVPRSVTPREHLDQLLRQVAAAQRNGFTLLALGQHFLYGDIRWLQPVPTLARLAAEVEPSVRLATTVLVAPLHHPVVLAEELATLDIVTDGRLVVGLGLGYRKEEYRQLGVPFGTRVPRFEEAVTLMRELWTSERVTFRGQFWHLEDAEPHLFPLQQPTPPLWIGASAEPGVRRAARLGDAWPIGPNMPVAEIEQHLATWASVREELGRPVGRQPIRREIVLGLDRADARARFAAMTSDRLQAYAARERATVGSGLAVAAEGGAALLGSPDDVVEQLRELAARLPVGPIVVRAQWPGMSGDDVCSYLEELGESVVRPLAGDC
jgi:alkanesulfonate monooxygenase SsuD/methylene tetrahydromethanopterin reductase-like flavin-dependent oxidoreductase (luciferase family)